MDEYKIQKSTLDGIADAINAKTGESSQMSPSEMVEKIAAISSGGDGVSYATGSGQCITENNKLILTISPGFIPKVIVVRNSSWGLDLGPLTAAYWSDVDSVFNNYNGIYMNYATDGPDVSGYATHVDFTAENMKIIVGNNYNGYYAGNNMTWVAYG